MAPPAVIVFDLNETLLDLTPLRAGFERVFGSRDPIGEWFARLLHGSLVANHLDDYRNFETIGAEALLLVAARRGVDLTAEEALDLVDDMTRLHAHPDVIPALELLVDAGFRTAALTNSSIRTANLQIESAGLHVFVQRVISVEEVRRYKPAPEPYLHAASLTGTAIEGLMLVSSHDWDVAGAMAAGARGAFVKRPGAVWSLPGPTPDLVVPDLVSLARTLLE